ncbi:endonuclease/exonuclease/phosphatase family protein [Solitalea sp. MAHUQ-68]|uniref:Endonuclease/exonuclease/phosphatase family protein n=1 Tax=Solitalea agri TaxID=2953739 RepID=A0A9X2F9E9_9SPHI|nr:endonuclease/exonuclease/phosphatase family protein [Solitalea agri]MCO4292903.1 endonuclease/exonuclease/phosphatase family protein [Solitalea agri]
MKKVFVSTAMAFLLLLNLAHAQSTKLKAVTFSLRHGEHPTGKKFDIEGIGSFLYDMQADFIALQDVDSMVTRSGNLNQPQVLEQVTGMYSVYVPLKKVENGTNGIALLSKWAITSTRKIELSAGKKAAPQAAILVNVIDGNKHPLTFICAFLNEESPVVRKDQLNAIYREILEIENPVIMAGNLNVTPEDLEYDQIQKKWQDSGSSAFTYESSGVQKRIDYILLSKRNTWNVLQYKVYTNQYSDHYPVEAKLEVF